MIGTTVSQYEILEQLGSGGMGVVYKAKDTKLNRVVALKFLPAQVSQDQKVKERFIQEARAASSLDDPHICTIHDIAETDDGQLYIVMAYYDGNTLKYVLEERQLGIDEACSIARQMTKGLGAAHEAGIVHRDVKPANIMVTSKGLVKILDFGVAKLEESSDLTREGSTIGTAAYMSPEQARGESVDRRSDLWSVGALLYEMLSGNRPFGGGYEAAVAYSILNEDPPSLDSVRDDLPDGLVELVNRCLSKKTDDRFSSAAELAEALSKFTDVSAVQTAEQPVAIAPQEASSVQSTVIKFSVIAAVVLAVLYAAMIGLGLPGWVFPAAVLLMLAGLPIIIYSSSLEKKRERLDTGEREKLSGLKGWLTTKRAFQGGVIAIGGLLVITVGFVGLRAAGVGPFATLISGGTLSQQDLLIVASFDNQTTDPTLGTTVTEAFKIDLSQSTVVRLMDRSGVQSALQRMQINADTTLDASLALAVAEREGVKAIVEGDINSAGASFILNARVLSALDGSQLAAFRETARDNTEIVDAIDRLSAKLREEIGESLVDIRGNEPLEQVTTTSVEALRLYTEADAMADFGRESEAIDVLKEAIEADSLFAMAYRKLAVLYNNTNADNSLSEAAATRAYELRDRLGWRERMLTEAYYTRAVENEFEEESRIYEEVLRRYPYELAALNNLALNYNSEGRNEEAEPLLRRALEVADGRVFRGNLVVSVINQGRIDDALRELDAYEEALPGLAPSADLRASVLFIKDDWEGTAAWIDTSRARADQPFQVANYHNNRNNLLMAMGQLEEAGFHRWERNKFFMARTIREEGDLPPELDSLGMALDLEHEKARLTGDSRNVESILAQMEELAESVGGIPDDEDPYGGVAFTLASLGKYDQAHEWVEQHAAYHERSGEEMSTFGNMVAAYVDANREGDVDAAIDVIQDGIEEFGCLRCWRIELAELHELKGDRDRAIEIYSYYIAVPALGALANDEGLVARSQFRLAALHEERGDLDEAITYYTKMTERWANADAVLQPQVAEAKRRIEALLDRKAREGS